MYGSHATYIRVDWWNWTFLNGKYLGKKSQSSNSKLQAVLKICCDFGEGAQCAPSPARIGLMPIFSSVNGLWNVCSGAWQLRLVETILAIHLIVRIDSHPYCHVAPLHVRIPRDQMDELVHPSLHQVFYQFFFIREHPMNWKLWMIHRL